MTWPDSPVPFIDAQDVSDWLGRDVTLDPGAITAIDAACDICRGEAEQRINAGTSTVSLDGAGTDCLLLPERPVTTVGTVTVNGVDEDEFMWTAEGKLLRGTAGELPRTAWPRGRQNVAVTYVHGWTADEIPRDIRVVALSVATRLIVQGIARAESIGETSVTYASASTELLPGEQRILRKYRQARSF